MATRGKQDISTSMSIKITGSYAKDTWYELTNSLGARKWLKIINMGVDNDLMTGLLWLSLRSDGVAETAGKKAAGIQVLAAGDTLTGEYGSNIVVNVLADTADMCIFIEELDGNIPYSYFDSG